MLQTTLVNFILRWRTVLSASVFLTTLYFILYTWTALPPLILMIGWHTETEMKVMQVVDPAYHDYLTPGDTVLSINGRPVQRRVQLFPLPQAATHELILQRGEDIFTQTIPNFPSTFYDIWRLSIEVLALAIWLLGFLTTRFARAGQEAPLIAGLGFQLIAAGIVSPGPYMMGAPGAWLVGQVLIWYFPLIVLYLGAVPLSQSLAPRVKSTLRYTFFILTCFALLETFEVLFLYPKIQLRRAYRHFSWAISL